MAVYYATLAALFGCAAILCRTGLTRRRGLVFGCAAFVLLGGLAAVRYAVGYDYTEIYVPLYFQVLRDDLPLLGGVHEPGFVLLEKIILLFTQNYQALFVTTSILIYGLLFYYYWKTSPNICLSVLLFLLLGQYYSSMNFVRQTLAAAITLFAVPFLKKRKLLWYMLIVLIAALFHKSALILIPFYFINLIPVSKYTLPVYALATAALYFSSGRLVSFVTKYWYTGYSPQSEEVVSTFAFPFTLSMAAAFALLFWGYGRLRSLDRGNYVYINYTFFALFFVLMGTRIGILDRFSVYFEMVIPAAVPMLLRSLENPPDGAYTASGPRRRRTALLLGIIAVWGLSIHHYILTEDNHGVVPYRWIFRQPVYREYTENLKEEPRGAYEVLLAHWAAGEIEWLPGSLALEPEGP